MLIHLNVLKAFKLSAFTVLKNACFHFEVNLKAHIFIAF
jgi:hypothetical protein